MQYIITIDGPAGSGKSTTAKALAAKLELPYLNTGLIYRVVGVMASWVGLLDKPLTCTQFFNDSLVEIDEAAETVKLTLEASSEFAHSQSFTIAELRTPAASDAASKIGEVSGMGSVLVALQQKCATTSSFQEGFVVEGRNTGTATFPNAFVKFFLTGSLEARRERIAQLHGEANAAIILERDERDGNRAEAPMQVPDGAIVIDNTHLPFDRVVVEMYGHICRAIQARAEMQ